MDYIHDLPAVKALLEDRNKLEDHNTSIAEENLSRQPLLEEKRNLVLSTFDAVVRQREVCEELTVKYRDVAYKYDPAAIQENLSTGALESEEQSELVAEDFLNGALNIDDFLQKYTHARSKSALRKVYADKLERGELAPNDD